jgi:hypothetical protein
LAQCAVDIAVTHCNRRKNGYPREGCRGQERGR